MTIRIIVAAAVALGTLSLPAAVQAQGCTFTLSRTNVVAGPEGPIFVRTAVTASAPDCQWSASTTAPWISVDSSTRSGNAEAFITLAANTTGVTRMATVAVAGQTVNVAQQASPCVTSLTPAALTFPYRASAIRRISART